MFQQQIRGRVTGFEYQLWRSCLLSSGSWWNDLRADDTLGCLSPVGSTSLWRISTFLNSEKIYIGFCSLPLGRWIQPWATWNYNNWSFRTCEHRKFKVVRYETWNSINWIFYVHIFIIQLHLKIQKANVLPSIHFPLFILSLSFCQPISAKLRSQALLMMKITLVSSVNGCYPPSAKEVDISLIHILVQENLFPSDR